MSERNVIVHLDWGRSPVTWRKRQEAGEVGQGDPYGYAAIGNHYSLTYSEDHSESGIARFVRRAMKQLVGFDFVHAWRNRDRLACSDYVVTHTEHEFLAVLLLDLLQRRERPRVVCNSIWLWDRWTQMSSLRRAILRPLLRRALVHTVQSSVNYDVARAAMAENRVVVLPFGIRPFELVAGSAIDPSQTIRILSAGNDRDRDWRTLAEALSVLGDTSRARIRSRRRDAQKLTSSTTVVSPSANVAEYYDDLAWADVVVIPLRQNRHVSGITVALEALSAGRKVVIADCGGLRDYLGDYVSYYEVGDSTSLVEAIMKSVDEPTPFSGQGFFEPHRFGLTARDYGLRHVLLLKGIEEESVPESVWAFRRVTVDS